MAIELWWEFRILKSGKRAKRAELVGVYRYTELGRCQHCNRLGSTAWVKRWWYKRFQLFGEDDPVLCIGCFNRMRPLWKVDREAHEVAALARKLAREIASAKKDENRRRSSRLPVGNDGGREERDC